MVTQFVFLKSDNRIINIDDIVQVNFCPEEAEDGEAIEEARLFIQVTGNDGDIEFEGKEAEKLYLQLVKKLPNVIVVE